MKYIKIKLNKSKPKLWDSKLGGIPYILKPTDYPLGDNNYKRKMFFIGQINFAQIPHIDVLPKSGILQFFIADDDLMGMMPTANKISYVTNPPYRLMYYPDVVEDESKLVTESGKLRLPKFNSNNIPFSSEYEKGMEFELADESTPSKGHKIGGMPLFTQNDPREIYSNRQYKPYTYQLLQLDGEGNSGPNWGDQGIAHFFIKPKALNPMRFEKPSHSKNALFLWDCV